MRIVLFLGAGFSRAWELPVMNEFFGKANSHRRLTEPDREFMRKLREKTRAGASMLQGPDDNLEHVLSFALMSLSIDRIPPSGGESEYDRLCRLLALVYGDVPHHLLSQYTGAIESLLGMGRTWNHELTLITTNYDLIPEIAFKPLGFRLSLPAKWKSHSNSSETKAGSLYDVGDKQTALCKLHGSVNWYNDTASAEHFLITDRQLLGQYVTERHEHKTMYLPEACYGNLKPPAFPLLVPPTFFKMQSDRRFDSIWRAAANALSTADRLAFIGYSFPESDTHMRYFIASHLVKNIDLSEILIIDPLAVEIRDRIRSKGEFGGTFLQRLKPITARWQESDVSVASEA